MKQNCPDGEKCTAYAREPELGYADAYKCVPIIGDIGFGKPCSRSAENDDCRKWLFCMAENSGGTGPGTCLEFCRDAGGYGVCEYGGQCFAMGESVIPLCWVECDPLAPDCIPDDEACYFVPHWGRFICVRTDHPPGEGADGDACPTIHACEPGLICFDGSLQNGCTAERCCTPVCEVGNDAVCTDPAESCVPWYVPGAAPPGLEDVGYCGVG